MVERTCETCHETFFVPPSTVKQGWGKFCSRRCYAKDQEHRPPCNKKERIQITCPTSDKKLFVFLCQIRNGKKFCSRSCAARARTPWNKGKRWENAPLWERIQSKIDYSADRKGHDLWIGSRSRAGYGEIGVARRTRLAHRVIWELAYGPIPPGLFVCHHCDIPACVKLEHLFLGTHDDNMRDAKLKGRMKKKSPSPVGEQAPSAKLTAAKVRQIRALEGQLTYKQIGDMFGVDQTNIGCIIRRRTWTHI